MKKKFKIVSIIMSLLILISGLVAYKVYGKLNKINKVDIKVEDKDLGIKQDIPQEKEIKNILILAVDKYENASDAMMIASIDEKNKSVKLTSVLRDLYVDLGEDKTNKLNYAYHYGGPLNTMKVINETFNLNIRDYVLVNFENVVNVVDAVGGVDLDLTYEEIHGKNALNERAKNLAKLINKPAPTPLEKAGVNHLNGIQAAGYARVRVIDNDFKRTDRERKLINEVIKKVKVMNLIEMDKFSDVALQNIETSCSSSEILALGKSVLSLYKNGIQETKIPIEGTWQGHFWDDGSFYFTWDKAKNVEYLRKFIYEK